MYVRAKYIIFLEKRERQRELLILLIKETNRALIICYYCHYFHKCRENPSILERESKGSEREYIEVGSPTLSTCTTSTLFYRFINSVIFCFWLVFWFFFFLLFLFVSYINHECIHFYTYMKLWIIYLLLIL